ncbi:hypothetical protein ACGH7X_41560 [Streptomyces sp. BBFR51]|uniref:hypothetical protein n=1 Tax=Streptomyces sp. BBFR51 TaxID=3372856 RepID=UPI0037DC7321
MPQICCCPDELPPPGGAATWTWRACSLVEAGTDGCVAHAVEAVHRVMRDPASRKVPAVPDSDRTTPRRS